MSTWWRDPATGTTKFGDFSSQNWLNLGSDITSSGTSPYRAGGGALTQTLGAPMMPTGYTPPAGAAPQQSGSNFYSPPSNQMMTDYNNYFANSQPGSSMNWAGGTLTRTDSGATYQPQNGAPVALAPGMDLGNIAAMSPEIAGHWKSQYGYQPTPQQGIPELFQPNLFPYNTSQGQTTQSNQNQANSFGGLPPEVAQQLFSMILPQLSQSVSGLNAVPGQTAEAAERMYGNLSRQALEQSLPGILNQLSGRGMLNSSVGSDAISNAARQIIPNFANAGYQAQIDAGNQRMQIPNILGNLLGLGSANTSTASGTGSSAGLNQSMQANPLAPYELLSQFLMGY